MSSKSKIDGQYSLRSATTLHRVPDHTREQELNQAPEEQCEIFYDDFADDPNSDFATALNNASEGDFHIGIIVALEKEYAIIWSPSHGHVRAQDERPGYLATQYQIATFVKYRCFEDVSSVTTKNRLTCICKFGAYSLDRMKKVLRSASEKAGRVIINVKINRFFERSHSREFNGAYETWIGPVLVPKDPRIDLNRECEVYVVFCPEYTFSKWVAFALKDEGEDKFVELSNLPKSVEEISHRIFDQACYSLREVQKTVPPISASRPRLLGTSSIQPTLPRYHSPSGWDGPEHFSDGTIANVIGIVIGHRRDKTIIHTAFGRAFEPNGPDILALGVWVLIWVKPVPDSENNMLFQFSTLKREKIGMVMGTRVVWFKSHEDVEPHQRIILSGFVKKGPRVIENQYLGQVLDNTKTPLPSTINNNRAAKKGFLVEMTLINQTKDLAKSAWQVKKYHGVAGDTIVVPLIDSFYSKEEGEFPDNMALIAMNKHWRSPDFTEDDEKQIRENMVIVASPMTPIFVPNINFTRETRPDQEQEGIQNTSTSTRQLSSEEEYQDEEDHSNSYATATDPSFSNNTTIVINSSNYEIQNSYDGYTMETLEKGNTQQGDFQELTTLTHSQSHSQNFTGDLIDLSDDSIILVRDIDQEQGNSSSNYASMQNVNTAFQFGQNQKTGNRGTPHLMDLLA